MVPCHPVEHLFIPRIHAKMGDSDGQQAYSSVPQPSFSAKKEMRVCVCFKGARYEVIDSQCYEEKTESGEAPTNQPNNQSASQPLSHRLV